MKKLIALLILVLVSFTSFEVYGKDFGNDDGDIRISLPRFVDCRKIVLNNAVKSAEIVDRSENYSNEYVSVNIYKPEVHLSNNPKSESAINNKINNIVNEFKNQIMEQSLKDNEFNKVNELPIKQYVVNVNNTIHYNKDNILSLTLHLYSYTGGAHGSTTDVSLNIDTNTGKNGTLKDFLGNNVGYDQIILSVIKDQVAQNPEMYFKENVDKITQLPYNQKFFLTDDGVVVYFNEYEIAPYVAGRPEFLIPYSKFPSGLNKVNIQEESPVITTMIMESSHIKNSYNQYICLPQLECYSLENKYINLNNAIKLNILKDIKDIEKNTRLQGITSYYTYDFKDKYSIILSMIYIPNYSNKIYDDVIVNYVVDLCKNKVYRQ